MRHLARPYLQHGRRHAKTGSDPIVGAAEPRWAIYGGNGSSTVVSGDITYVGIDWWTWGPSDQNLYSLGAGTGGLASLGALQVDAEGVYKVSLSVGFIGTAGAEFSADLPGFYADWHDSNTQAELAGNVKLGDLDPTHDAKFVTFQSVVLIGGLFTFAEVAPWAPVFRFQTISGSGDVSTLEILVEWMSSDYDSTVGVGGTP